jgi:hypothetical protein
MLWRVDEPTGRALMTALLRDELNPMRGPLAKRTLLCDLETEERRRSGHPPPKLQGERPGRPQRALVGCIAVRARLDAVILRLEEQIGHLPRPHVEQIGRQPSVQCPDLATVGPHGLGERW